MPAAQAVDYVKCEAIQKAQSRIRVSLLLIEQEQDRESERAREGAVSDCDHLWSYTTGSPPPEWKACIKKALTSSKYAVPNRDQEIEQLEKRAERVQADYDASGCY